MSIANNIDGSNGGANQLLDLLSLVSNPKVYESKIKALQDATDENKKYVDLVGPASEILQLRAEAEVATQNAKDTVENAKAQALQLVNDAKRKADAMIGEAKVTAAKLENEAKALSEVAKQKAADASLAETQANAVKVELDKGVVELNKKLAEADAAKQAAKEAETMFNKAYDSIIESL